MLDQAFGFDAAQVKALTARQDRHGHLSNFGGREEEFDVFGRFFERFQQAVESLFRQHVRLIDDEDFITRHRGTVFRRLNHLADIVDAGVAGRVHLDHVDMTAFDNRRAMFAGAAGFDGWPALSVRTDAVETFRDNPGGRGFPDTAHAGQNIGVVNAVFLKGIAEHTHHRLLPDKGREILRPVFSGQHLISAVGCFGHGAVDPRVMIRP